ncbi:hypothetical protein [Flaviflagellibacter deserti]|uniref:Uncharacterized protein n=1 Tax=Flaviflagellibacter deserti TaxID=2267266 RepID=A0ABV9Z1U1_9HYPH
MPRNGSGTYIVPNTFTPGTVISSSTMNANFSDAGQAITDSLARDGQGGMLGQFKASDGTNGAPGISFVSDTDTGIRRVGTGEVAFVADGADVLTYSPTAVGAAQPFMAAEAISAAKQVNFAAAGSIVAAATTDLGSVASNTVTVTGNTTITSLGTAAAGVERWVRFTGTPTLTYNATSLILPGATNITAAAGDIAYFKSEGSGNWRCWAFLRGSGVPATTPGVTVDNTALRFNGTGGAIQTSTLVINDDGSITQPSAGAETIPTGTTVQRPTGVEGMIRYNTDLDRLEYYDAGAWRVVQRRDWDFTSAEQAVTAGAELVMPHGLGAIPTKLQIVLRCKAANLGWAVDDEVHRISDSAFGTTNNNTSSVGLGVDATNIYLSTDTTLPNIAPKTGGNATTITVAAAWAYVVRASL